MDAEAHVSDRTPGEAIIDSIAPGAAQVDRLAEPAVEVAVQNVGEAPAEAQQTTAPSTTDKVAADKDAASEENLEDELFGDSSQNDAQASCAANGVDGSGANQMLASVGRERLTAAIAEIIPESSTMNDLNSLSMKKVYLELEGRSLLDLSTLDQDSKTELQLMVKNRIDELTSTPTDDEGVADDDEDRKKRKKEKKEKKRRRRREQGEHDDAETPAKQARRSRRAASNAREALAEPLFVDVAGTQFQAMPRATASGKPGYMATQKIIAQVGGRTLQLQCLIQCAVIGEV